MANTMRMAGFQKLRSVFVSNFYNNSIKLINNRSNMFRSLSIRNSSPHQQLVDVSIRLRRLVKSGRLSDAIRFFDENFAVGGVERKLQPDAAVFNILLRGWIDSPKCDVERAFESVSYMVQHYHVQPSDATLVSLSEAVAKHGQRRIHFRRLLQQLSLYRPNGWRDIISVQDSKDTLGVKSSVSTVRGVHWLVVCAVRFGYNVPDDITRAVMEATINKEQTHLSQFSSCLTACKTDRNSASNHFDLLDCDWLSGTNLILGALASSSSPPSSILEFAHQFSPYLTGNVSGSIIEGLSYRRLAEGRTASTTAEELAVFLEFRSQLVGAYFTNTTKRDVSEPLLHFQLPLTAIDRLLYLADQLSNEAYPKSDFIAMLFSPFTVIAGVSDFPQKSKSDVALYALNLWIGYLNPRRQAEFGSALQHRFRTSATHFASAVPIIPKWLNIRCVPNLTPLFLETASNIQQFSNPTEDELPFFDLLEKTRPTQASVIHSMISVMTNEPSLVGASLTPTADSTYASLKREIRRVADERLHSTRLDSDRSDLDGTMRSASHFNDSQSSALDASVLLASVRLLGSHCDSLQQVKQQQNTTSLYSSVVFAFPPVPRLAALKTSDKVASKLSSSHISLVPVGSAPFQPSFMSDVSTPSVVGVRNSIKEKSVSEDDTVWTLSPETFATLSEMLTENGTVVIMSDQAAVRGWMDSVFERGGAAAAIHRQQMAAMTAKTSAEEPTSDADIEKEVQKWISKPRHVTMHGKEVVIKASRIPDWCTVLSLSLSSLMKLAGIAAVNDQHMAHVKNDSEQAAELQRLRVSQSELEVQHTEQYLGGLPRELQTYLLALASSKTVSTWPAHSHRSHSRFYVLQKTRHVRAYEAETRSMMESSENNVDDQIPPPTIDPLSIDPEDNHQEIFNDPPENIGDIGVESKTKNASAGHDQRRKMMPRDGASRGSRRHRGPL